MLHGTQLALIQLAGGIAVGVHLKDPEYKVRVLKFPVSETISLGVRTTAPQICFRLSNYIT